MAELNAEQVKKTAAADLLAKEKLAEARLPDFKKVQLFGVLFLDKLRTKEGKYKKEAQKALDAAEKAAKEVDSLKAKKTQTLTNKGTKLVLIEGYPVSDYFADLFNDKQKAQYFKK